MLALSATASLPRSSSRLLELSGFRHQLARLLLARHAELGPLPSTGVTPLHRYYEPIRLLERATPLAFRACSVFTPRAARSLTLRIVLCTHAAPTTPVDRWRAQIDSHAHHHGGLPRP